MKKYKNFITLTTLILSIQSLLYFSTKLLINNYNIINSFIEFPLIKIFVYPYNLWYPFIILNMFIIYKYDKNKFGSLITTMLITTIMANITFIIYPSMMIRPNIEITNLTTWLLDYTYKIDTPAVNCLPSMHCMFCFVTNYYIINSKNININKKILITISSSIIVLSTLFIKQHIIEDAILALIYTTLAIIITYINKNKIKKLFSKIIQKKQIHDTQ